MASACNLFNAISDIVLDDDAAADKTVAVGVGGLAVAGVVIEDGLGHNSVLLFFPRGLTTLRLGTRCVVFLVCAVGVGRRLWFLSPPVTSEDVRLMLVALVLLCLSCLTMVVVEAAAFRSSLSFLHDWISSTKLFLRTVVVVALFFIFFLLLDARLFLEILLLLVFSVGQ